MTRTLQEKCPVIDYPREGESIVSPEYSLRISAPAEAKKVEVSIDQGAWQACRHEGLHWWFDWRGYPAGDHELVVRAQNEDGKTRVSEPQECSVQLEPESVGKR